MLKQLTRPEKVLLEYERPLVVANYFGFSPIKAPKITEKDVLNAKHCTEHPHYDAVERASFIRTYIEENLAALPHPLAVSYKKFNVKKRPEGYSLHFVGSSSNLPEAALIRSALSILSEEGYKNLKVDLNCIGDKDSIAVYERELGNSVRKLGSNLSPEMRDKIKEDIFNIFRVNNPEMISLRESVPPSINGALQRAEVVERRAQHVDRALVVVVFEEVLEAMEILGIEFNLLPSLVGERNHSSHTIFSIRNDSGSEAGSGNTLAVGYRYSRLGRRLGLRKEVPMAGVNIINSLEKETGNKLYKDLPKSRFYLVQLGQTAKLKSLNIMETLRSHRIKVHHFIGKDKLAPQLTHADSLKISHMIIIGQKEALDNTATIRNVSTRAQDTIDISLLPDFLKKLPI